MSETFTNKDVKAYLGLSPAGIRNYCQHYSRYLSTEATPDPGMTRRFTLADIKLFAYVRDRTNQGTTHLQILPEIENGALDSFEWDIPASSAYSAHSEDADHTEPTTAALVPASTLAAYQTLLSATEKRLQSTENELNQARARIEMLQSEVGDLTGQNKMLKVPWWKRLFGIYD